MSDTFNAVNSGLQLHHSAPVAEPMFRILHIYNYLCQERVSTGKSCWPWEWSWGEVWGLETNLFPFAVCTQFHHHPSDYYTKKTSIMGLLYILLFSWVFLLRNLNALVKPEHNLVSVTEITAQRWICFLFCLCYLLDYAFYFFRYLNWLIIRPCLPTFVHLLPASFPKCKILTILTFSSGTSWDLSSNFMPQ